MRKIPEPTRPNRVTPEAWAHSVRFRHVSKAYPNRVAAYDGDLARAMADDPETVAARVADWEGGEGRDPTDWRELGRTEGHAGQDPGPGDRTERARVSRLGEPS